MSDYITVKKDIINYLRARTPLIIVETSERERMERMLREISHELNTRINYYSNGNDVTCFGGNDAIIDINGDPLGYASKTFKTKKNFTFAISDMRHIDNDNAMSREMLNIIYLAKQSSGTVILVTADNVWSRLTVLGMLTKLDFPNMSERLDIIEKFISEYKNMYTIDYDKEDMTYAAALLRGFSEMQMSNILCSEIIANNGFLKANIRQLVKQKNRLYGSIPNIQQVSLPNNMKIAGLDLLKEWLKEKKRVFFMTDKKLQEYDIAPPKGILLAGVPGCGKSYSAKMIANQWDLPLFKFDIGNIYDKWLGESERKMKDALNFIDNVAPCVLWIDEIEKVLSINDSTNDTGKRIFGQFLFWLQESTSRVFLVATANDITSLPLELFRKGRFSEVFFIGLPNREERLAAIKQYVASSIKKEFTDEEYEELTTITKGYSYADIEVAIKDVTQYMLVHGDSDVTMDFIKDKIKSIIPIYVSNKQLIEQYTKWGSEHARQASKGGDE